MYNCDICLHPSKLNQRQLRVSLSKRPLYTETYLALTISSAIVGVAPDQDTQKIVCEACHLTISTLLTERRTMALMDAQNPQTATRRLEELSHCATEDAALREALAQNPNTPPGALEELAAEHFLLMSENPALVLLSLEDPSRVASWALRFGREQVQKGLPLSAELLAQLSDDSEEHTRYYVALHRSTSEDTLKALAQDKSSLVRMGVASNLSSSRAVFCLLAQSKESLVLKTIAWNKEAPQELREMLAKDDSIWEDPENALWRFDLTVDRGPYASRAKRRQHRERTGAKERHIRKIKKRRKSAPKRKTVTIGQKRACLLSSAELKFMYSTKQRYIHGTREEER